MSHFILSPPHWRHIASASSLFKHVHIIRFLSKREGGGGGGGGGVRTKLKSKSSRFESSSHKPDATLSRWNSSCGFMLTFWPSTITGGRTAIVVILEASGNESSSTFFQNIPDKIFIPIALASSTLTFVAATMPEVMERRDGSSVNGG